MLKVSNLCFSYSDKPILKNISFNVKEGELFALLGVNGAGKSTTINIICTLIDKKSGEVFVNGYSLGKENDNIRKSLGVVFQGNVLDNMLTAEENLLCRASFYGLSQPKAKKRISDLAKNLSMESFLNQHYGELSGGQRRKCDIARALITEPRILILDEPTTGLDPQSRIDLWDTIEQIRKSEKMTVLLTTHYMEEASNADKIAIIDNGEMLCCDTPQSLKTHYSLDTVKLIPKRNEFEKIENFLKSGNISFTFNVDTFFVNMENGLNAIDFIAKNKENLDSVEILKGNMDNVFLNVVGRRFENE
ncbi:MAG: ABC transporter ATP-binding protein [Bacillota bacterium]|nr:ABC transporter ATP-binding protein [Bacillota bacterium]